MRRSAIYTAANCSFSSPLQWGVSVFWRANMVDDGWLADLTNSLKPDGVRLLSHRFAQATVSQFLVSTLPEIKPVTVVQRLKGRLQYLVRQTFPRAFKGNYAIRSLRSVTRQLIANYVARQVDHHRFADVRFIERLRSYQIDNAHVDLSQPQRTTHGLYWHVLHLVIVRRNRESEWHDQQLAATRDMIIKAAATKGYLLSRAGILPDHVHLLLGCPIEEAPREVALGFLNNLASVHGMQPVFQFGAFVGTVGEYSTHALKNDIMA